MTVVSMSSSVTTGMTRRRRGEARRGVARAARGAAERGGDERDAVTTRETRANASVDGMKDARALAPTRGVGRERVVATVGTSSTAAATRAREATSSGRGARAASLGGAAVVVGGAAAVAMNRVMKAKSGGKDPEMRVLDRYADLIVDAYDIPIVPNFAEGTVYREICKTAYEMALKLSLIHI